MLRDELRQRLLACPAGGANVEETLARAIQIIDPDDTEARGDPTAVDGMWHIVLGFVNYSQGTRALVTELAARRRPALHLHSSTPWEDIDYQKLKATALRSDPRGFDVPFAAIVALAPSFAGDLDDMCAWYRCVTAPAPLPSEYPPSSRWGLGERHTFEVKFEPVAESWPRLAAVALQILLRAWCSQFSTAPREWLAVLAAALFPSFFAHHRGDNVQSILGSPIMALAQIEEVRGSASADRTLEYACQFLAEVAVDEMVAKVHDLGLARRKTRAEDLASKREARGSGSRFSLTNIDFYVSQKLPDTIEVMCLRADERQAQALRTVYPAITVKELPGIRTTPWDHLRAWCRR